MTRILRTLPALCVLAALAGCGSSHPASSSASSAAAPASTVTTATSPGTPAQTAPATSSNPSSSPAQPAGGPVPPGFDPVSFTAISDQEFWLLGTAPCSNPVCTSIVRTTDGGAHFVGIPAPVAPLALGTRSGVSELRFANSRDGFAGPAAFATGEIWSTHDGGEHWHPDLAGAFVFTVSHDRVYALTGNCANGTCTQLALAASPAGTDQWTSTPLPLKASSGGATLTAYGDSVWLSLSPGAGTSDHQVLYRSDDAGRTFQTYTSPCFTGLGGDLEASSAQVVWATCPTGMMAQALRSSDAGAHWQTLPIGRPDHYLPLSNGARIAPASDQAAVISAGGVGALYRTVDGGSTFATVMPSNPNGSGWYWIGFTDPMTGSALTARPGVGVNGMAPFELWRSSDGGGHWSGPVAIR